MRPAMTPSRPAHEAIRVISRERMTVIPRYCRHRQSLDGSLAPDVRHLQPEHLLRQPEAEHAAVQELHPRE